MGAQLARSESGIDRDVGVRLEGPKATKPRGTNTNTYRRNAGNDQRQSIWKLMLLKDESGGGQ